MKKNENLLIFLAALTNAKKIFLDFVGCFPALAALDSKLFDCNITIHKHPLSENFDPLKVSTCFLFVSKKIK